MQTHLLEHAVASPVGPMPIAELGLDRKSLKELMRRSNAVPLRRLALCLVALGFLGYLYVSAMGSRWFLAALFLFGSTLSLTVYSLSHECSHGTVFRSRWLNETIFWATSLLFGQEVLYRRYSHAAHHTHTMFVGHDAQLPFAQPVGLKAYFLWYSGVLYHSQFLRVLFLHSLGRFSDKTRSFTPPEELPRMVRNSRLFIVIYAGAAAVSWYFSTSVLLWIWLLPKLAGDPVMLTYAGSQHFEKEENTIDLRRSTRSLRPNRLIDLFYWNMSFHIEHHLYPTVPFFALPKLNALIKDRLPEPEGILSATGSVFHGWWLRSFRQHAAD
ncbi:MAG TPA: fatty acid desaturase [Steroidobacteraceae bacterium]|jgi:fatty acid desaturase